MAAVFEDTRTGFNPDPSLDRWVAHRCGQIANRIGTMLAPAHGGRHKLSSNEWRALAVVARFEPLSAAILSEHSRLDPSRVSRAIDVLVGKRLITREKDPADQRRALVQMTPRGRTIYADIARSVHTLERELVATLTTTEQRALWSAFDKIDKQLKRKSEGGGTA